MTLILSTFFFTTCQVCATLSEDAPRHLGPRAAHLLVRGDRVTALVRPWGSGGPGFLCPKPLGIIGISHCDMYMYIRMSIYTLNDVIWYIYIYTYTCVYTWYMCIYMIYVYIYMIYVYIHDIWNDVYTIIYIYTCIYTYIYIIYTYDICIYMYV